jgi:hypothetical protein
MGQIQPVEDVWADGEIAAIPRVARYPRGSILNCHSAKSAVAFGDTNSVGIAGTDFKLSRSDLFEF